MEGLNINDFSEDLKNGKVPEGIRIVQTMEFGYKKHLKDFTEYLQKEAEGLNFKIIREDKKEIELENDQRLAFILKQTKGLKNEIKRFIDIRRIDEQSESTGSA